MPDLSLEEGEQDMTITDMIRNAHEHAKSRGFWDTDPEDKIPEKIALIHSNASKALEWWREGHNLRTIECDDNNGKPTGFPIELADIHVLVADLAGALGIDLEKAIAEKMAFNATRPHRHGGKRA